MTREEAHEFIKLYRKFANTGITIKDLTGDDEIELKLTNGNFVRKSDWYAAKVIEANS